LRKVSIAIGFFILVGLIVGLAINFLFRATKPSTNRDSGIIKEGCGSEKEQCPGWTSDLGKMKIPDQRVSGVLVGRQFVCDNAILQSNILHLRHGGASPPELGLTGEFRSVMPAELIGKKFVFGPGASNAPKLIIRGREALQGRRQTITAPFALVMEFDPLSK